MARQRAKVGAHGVIGGLVQSARSMRMTPGATTRTIGRGRRGSFEAC